MPYFKCMLKFQTGHLLLTLRSQDSLLVESTSPSHYLIHFLEIVWQYSLLHWCPPFSTPSWNFKPVIPKFELNLRALLQVYVLHRYSPRFRQITACSTGLSFHHCHSLTQSYVRRACYCIPHLLPFCVVSLHCSLREGVQYLE